MEKFLNSIDQLSRNGQGKLFGGFAAVFAATNVEGCVNKDNCDNSSNDDVCSNHTSCKDSSNGTCSNPTTCYY